MAYVNSEFPRRIALNAVRTPGWQTTVVQTFGGYTHANVEWADVRHEYDVSLSIRTASDYAAVLAHFHEMRGRAHSFPFKDFLDHTASSEEGSLELVSGSVYQMHKVYGESNPYSRIITRPVSGKCTFYRTRSSVTSTISPSVNYSTGRVTVSGHASGDVYTWAGEFVVPCRYTIDRMPAVAADRQMQGGELLVHVDGITLQEDREA